MGGAHISEDGLRRGRRKWWMYYFVSSLERCALIDDWCDTSREGRAISAPNVTWKSFNFNIFSLLFPRTSIVNNLLSKSIIPFFFKNKKRGGIRWNTLKLSKEKRMHVRFSLCFVQVLNRCSPTDSQDRTCLLLRRADIPTVYWNITS